VEWHVVDGGNCALECEILDKAWEEEEWIRLPQCETVNFSNSPKSQNSHYIPYIAPNDAIVNTATRKVFRSYTPTGAVTVLRLPRAKISGPGRIECAEIFVNPFERRLAIPNKPQMQIPQFQVNNNSHLQQQLQQQQEEEQNNDNTYQNPDHMFKNPFLKEPVVFKYDPKPPALGDVIEVKFANGYYTGKVKEVFPDEKFNLVCRNGKLFKENPVSLKMKDQSDNEENEDQWYFISRV
jgi:hypothetical protein